MEKTIEDLKLEADALGITYMKNIGADKLQAKIDAYYEADSKANTVVAEEKIDEPEVEEKKAKIETAKKSALEIIREQERANMESVIIKVTMVDKREASTATHAYFGTGDVAMNVPLDIFVEVPKIIARMAEDAKALVHMQTEHGAVPKMQKKYVVEYKR